MKKWSFVFGLGAVLALSLAGSSVKAASCPLATDAMYKSPGSKAVYYITADCKKQLVKSPEVFFSYADSWSEVKGTNYATLMSVPDHSLRILPWGPKRDFLGGSLVKSPTDPRVFLVTNFTAGGVEGQTTLVPFDSVDAITKNGFLWSWVEDVSQSVINKHVISTEKIKANVNFYPAGVLFKIEASPILFITRPDKENRQDGQYAELITTLDNLKQREYRYDHIPVLSIGFYYDMPEVFSAKQNGTYLNDQTGNQGTSVGTDIVCSDNAPATQDPKVWVVCPGTTMRTSEKRSLRVKSISGSQVVLESYTSMGTGDDYIAPLGIASYVQYNEDSYSYQVTLKYLAGLGVASSGKQAAQIEISVFGVDNCDRATYGYGENEFSICAGRYEMHNPSGVNIKVESFGGDTATIKPMVVVDRGNNILVDSPSMTVPLGLSYRFNYKDPITSVIHTMEIEPVSIVGNYAVHLKVTKL